MKIVMEHIFLKEMFNILKSYIAFTIICPYYLKEQELQKVKRLLATLHDEKEYVLHMTNLKTSVNLGLLLKKVGRVIKFNQESWFKPCMDLNKEVRQNPKGNFKKYYLSYIMIIYNKYLFYVDE